MGGKKKMMKYKTGITLAILLAYCVLIAAVIVS
jgi:hypothetical protein